MKRNETRKAPSIYSYLLEILLLSPKDNARSRCGDSAINIVHLSSLYIYYKYIYVIIYYYFVL